MTASPNFAHRISEEIDEVYTFPTKHKKLGYDLKQSTVLVRYEEGETTVIMHDPPGVEKYYTNYPDAEDNEESRRFHDLSNEIVDHAREELSQYDPEISSWTSNSGNRSLRDIYVKVEKDQVEQVLIIMYQILSFALNEYTDFLQEYREEELVEPTATLEDKVADIIANQTGSVTLDNKLDS